MKKLPYLEYSKIEVSTLINQLCPAQFQEAARAAWALSNPKEALLTYAERLDFRDGCRGQFRKALANILTDIATYVDDLHELGYRLLPAFDIGLYTIKKDRSGPTYGITKLRRITIWLINQQGRIEKRAFDDFLDGPFEVDISEYLRLSNYDKIQDMKAWRTTVNRSLKEVIKKAQLEPNETVDDAVSGK